jgi:prepilin-type N-terminal cleavage/methylation domain-containing protein
MFTKIQKRMRSQKGFTLIELLVVIIIIAILAAIAIPTFLGQRSKAQDAAAKSLVRNAMTSIESAYVDTQDFSTVTLVMLQGIEPAIAWPDKAAAAGICSAPAATSLAKSNIVSWTGTAAATYEVGTWSQSGTEFGVLVNKAAGGGTTYYKAGAAVAAGAVW